MGISYDSSTNTIIVVDFPQDNPCTFEDVYQVSVNNGWNVVSKQGDVQYSFNCKLQIGDGTTETWFKDMNKQIVHIPNDDFILVKSCGHFILGEVVDATQRTTKNGCDVIDFASGKYLINVEQDGEVHLYSTRLSAINSAYVFYRGYKTHRLWNVIFDNIIQGSWKPIAEFDVFHLIAQNGSTILLNGININEVYVSDTDYGISIFPDAPDIYTRNTKLINIGLYDIQVWYYSNNFYAINVDCGWNIQWNSSPDAKIWRQNTFNLKVVDKDGNPVQGASVKIYDVDGNLVVDEITNASGEIPEQILTYCYYDQDHEAPAKVYSPYTIEISASGYQTYTIKFDILRPEKWVIALQPPSSSPAPKYPAVIVDQEAIV